MPARSDNRPPRPPTGASASEDHETAAYDADDGGTHRGEPTRARWPPEAARNTGPSALEEQPLRDTTHENRACCEISTPPGSLVGTSWAPPGRDRGARSANDVHAMTTTTTTTTKWSVRQRAPAGNAIVWLRAPTAAAAAKCANERVGPLGGWRTDVDLEVFPRAEYPERAEPQDYTRSVIDRPDSDFDGARARVLGD